MWADPMREEVISREPYRVYPRTDCGALLTGLMHDAQKLLRQELALAKHEIQIELRKTIRAVMCLGIGIGIAGIAGWLLILMVVHLVHALTALSLWACYGIVGGLCAVPGESYSSSASRS